MDIIVERDGKKVKLSDLGVIVKDFIVSSVEFEEHHEDIEGMAGGVDNGVSIGRRSISVPITFKSQDLLDFPLLRDELFELFHPSGFIYVQEMRRPKNLAYDFVDFGWKPKYEDGTENVLVGGKRYKVRISSPFDFEQFKTYGSTVLEFRTVGLPYSESVYTTKELNDTGYSALVEKYGLVDGINEEYTKYKFFPEKVNQNIGAFTFKRGFINSTTGAETTVEGNNFLITEYIVSEDKNKYTFEDIGNNSDVIRWWIYEYDVNKNFIGAFSTGTKYLEFTAKGRFIRFMVQGATDTTLNPDEVTSTSTSINPKLRRLSRTNTFSVWNGGNVTIEPETMYLNITALGALQDIEIRNKTTGDILRINAPHGGTLRVHGMSISLASVNVFRYTNHRYISLVSGLNEIEVIGQYTDIEFDFRFYYK